MPALANVARESRYVSVRVQAVRALGEIGGPAAEEEVATAVRDDDVSVRLAAVDALRLIRTPGATAAVRAALQDEDEEVRSRAAAALEELRGADER